MAWLASASWKLQSMDGHQKDVLCEFIESTHVDTLLRAEKTLQVSSG